MPDTPARTLPDPDCPDCCGDGYISSWPLPTSALAFWCKCTEPKPVFDWLKSIRDVVDGTETRLTEQDDALSS